MNSAAIIIALVLLIGAIGTILIAREMHRSTGLPSGRVIYSDTSSWVRNDLVLFSKQHRIAGKPDYLVRDGNTIIPVEVKSSAAPTTPRQGHIMQLAAYCLLVEETQMIRPAYGIIQYQDRQFAIDYTEALRDELLLTAECMRADAQLPDGPQRSHDDAARCATCGLRDSCNQRLA